MAIERSYTYFIQDSKSFTITEEESRKDSDLEILNKIEKIIVNQLAFHSTAKQKYNQTNIVEKLKSDVVAIEQRNNVNLSFVNHEIVQTCERVKSLLNAHFFNFPSEVIQHVMSFLLARELLNVREVNKQGKSHAELALIDRAKMYRCEIADLEYESATSYLQKLFQTVQQICKNKMIADEHIVRYERTETMSSFKELGQKLLQAVKQIFYENKVSQVSYEETLRKIRDLDPQEMSKLNDHLLTAVKSQNEEQIQFYSVVGAQLDEESILYVNKKTYPDPANRVNVLRLFLKFGCKSTVADENGNTPLLINFDLPDAINMLCQAGANVNHQNKRKFSALHFAVGANVSESVKVLLQNKADPHLKDSSKQSPILLSLMAPSIGNEIYDQEANSKIIEHLLRTDTKWESAILPYYLWLNPSSRIVKLLCELIQELRPTEKNEAYSEALQSAVTKNQLEIAEILLSYGANPNQKLGAHQITALQAAVLAHDVKAHGRFISRACDSQMVELLCQNKTDPNIQDLEGNSALHYAVMRERFELIEIFLQYKADLSLKNLQNQTPKDLAMKIEDKKSRVEMLKCLSKTFQ